jgi:hypothetical protein
MWEHGAGTGDLRPACVPAVFWSELHVPYGFEALWKSLWKTWGYLE